MKILAISLVLCLLSSCYAVRLELDDPMGLPWDDTVLSLAVSSPQQPELAQQLASSLLQQLPRERHVRTVSAAALCQQAEQNDCSGADWQLAVSLDYQSQTYAGPPAFFSPQPGPERLRVQMTLKASLSDAQGQAQHFSWTQAGDALPESRQKLEQQILRILQQRLIQALQPHYREALS
ncbi:MAG: hypothetical protein IGS03_19325 [Candidatus Sericytochromatia bacterium]|nr:hypothetical protein [Candidatus Sericytochromatia bacterium]